MPDYDAEREENREKGQLADIRLQTWVPSKWRVVDLETGDIWRYNQETDKFEAATDIKVAVRSGSMRRAANGAGTVMLRSDGRWMARYFPIDPSTGQFSKKRKTFYGKTEEEVLVKLTAIYAEELRALTANSPNS